jgi:hypothetical protein
MPVVVDRIELVEPVIRVVCLVPNVTMPNAVLSYDIKCLECETGMVFDQECDDCVPACFDQFLEYINNMISYYSQGGN